MAAARRRTARETRAPHRQARASAGRPILLIGAVAALAGLVVVGIALFAGSGGPGNDAAPISRVDTQDVHSLAFLGSAQRIVLGHHHGILESNDGGITWTRWGTGSDAMALGVAPGQPVIVAGHHVLASGSPDGEWADIANDLPHTDIHGLARDPNDPDRLWAYLADGGLYESRDQGRRWEEVFDGHAVGVFAVDIGGTTRLLAVDPALAAIVASDDGGRGWTVIGPPPSTPVYALAAAKSGSTVLLSGSDGLFRSDDAGRTFTSVLEVESPVLAVAVSVDGRAIIVAAADRQIYRSDDGGQTWPGAG